MEAKIEKLYTVFPENPPKNQCTFQCGEEKPLDPKMSYRLVHTAQQEFLNWPKDPTEKVNINARAGYVFTKTQHILERPKEKPVGALWPKLIKKRLQEKRLPDQSIQEVKNCMAAQDELMAIRDLIVKCVEKAMNTCVKKLAQIEWNPDIAMEMAAHEVRTAIEKLNVPGLIEAANQKLLEEETPKNGKTILGFFELIAARNGLGIVLEKNEKEQYFLRQFEPRGGTCH
ncbi:MAG: hypothetical protein UT33_C0005G0024 [Candidatus Peregrinibacteria bacterium GW2011_GWC2_39_14]|nr:MAG: hypothetical protein US92_C0001G0024 [Candidatus Peregrinibacteria bacterium GW2011_GWA2_38_36]KKR07080.1 MAG: hypothetical protein UT33_C0005G0024 [Candidatus Peregrinibacteria bacterium GW2011_GWC2_39_14]